MAFRDTYDTPIIIKDEGSTIVAAASTMNFVGSGVTATGSGSDATVNISSGGGGFTWNNTTGTTQSMSTDNGYISNNASQSTFTLPTTAAVGKVVAVAGSGAGGWILAQNASQYIQFGPLVTTTGTGGSLTSTNQFDSVQLVCIVANDGWSVISSIGNISIV